MTKSNLGGGSRAKQALAGSGISSIPAKEQVRIEQGERDDGFGISFGPFAFEICFLKAVAQSPTVECLEMLVETLHFNEPLALGDQRFRADNEYRGNIRPSPQFLEDKPGLNCLADAHFVGDQQPRTIRTDQSQNRAVLIGYELNASGTQRIQIRGRRRKQMQTGQEGSSIHRH